MENLKFIDLKELTIKESKNINGGIFWTELLISTLIDIIENPNSFISGYNDARS